MKLISLCTSCGRERKNV